MKWSKVKVMVEDLLCASLKGRVQYQVVVHRKSHDQTSSFRVTLDGKEIFRASDIPYEMAVNRRGWELQWEREVAFPWEIPWPEIEDSEDYKAYHRAYADGTAEVESQEIFHSSEIKSLLFDYVHMPFEEAVSHAHPFVRAISLFDRRFGKRRGLQKLIASRKRDCIRRFIGFVCKQTYKHNLTAIPVNRSGCLHVNWCLIKQLMSEHSLYKMGCLCI